MLARKRGDRHKNGELAPSISGPHDSEEAFDGIKLLASCMAQFSHHFRKALHAFTSQNELIKKAQAVLGMVPYIPAKESARYPLPFSLSRVSFQCKTLALSLSGGRAERGRTGVALYDH